MFRILTPHYRVHCVWELTPERLRLWGLRALLLDIDCTLSRYHSEVLPEAALWIQQIRAADFRLCLVSNGISERIEQFAGRLDLPFVSRAMKPLPWGVWAAIKKLDAPPSQTALIGDQVFADVMAGRVAGVRTILVDPIHPEEEPWFTRLKRWPERVVLARQEA
ncbi:MAG: YqeG family HAD IIIA-type phosphatase [Thermoguttaceae bacterium]|jgi:HAD superfamily phosphatase (TIGR01668 family)